MPRSERTRSRGRTAPIVALLPLALIGAGGAPAGAQAAEDPFAAYGGFNASARSGGVQISYDVKGVLPLPPPLLEVTVPTSRATSASGPSTLAFGSMAYPGDLIGNLPSLVEQASPGSGALVPPYPLATMASFPTGPASNRQDVGTASATVQASSAGAGAVTSLAGSSVPGVVELGGVTTSAQTGLEDGRIAARSRTRVASLSLLAGLVRFDDVVTDIVAASDGKVASTAGTTTIGSASVLGVPITLGPDGVAEAGDPLTSALRAVLGSATGSVNDLLAAAGVRIGLAPVEGTHEGARAEVEGAGLRIDLTFDGSDDGPLARLLALLPSDQLPGNALPGVPLNTSPQALVNLLKETHVARVTLATATAGVDASPAFTTGGRSTGDEPTTTPTGSAPSFAGPSGVGLPEFTTPLPVLTGRPGVAVASRGTGLVVGRAVGVLLVLLGLLSLPVWGAASARLMDAALVDRGPGCSDAIDGPSTGGGTRGARRPGPDG